MSTATARVFNLFASARLMWRNLSRGNLHLESAGGFGGSCCISTRVFRMPSRYLANYLKTLCTSGTIQEFLVNIPEDNQQDAAIASA